MTFGEISLWWIHTCNDCYINLYLYMHELRNLKTSVLSWDIFPIPHISYHFLKWIQKTLMSKSLKFSINEKRILIFFFTLIIWLKLDHKVPHFFLYVHEYKLQNLPFSTFSDYSCAYIGDILLHGSIYISQNWICFYSKIRARGRRVRNS